jgi:hypothetical protein
VEDPVPSLEPAAAPRRVGEQADREVGTGAGEPDRIEGMFVQLRAPGAQLVGMGAPGGDGVTLVKPYGVGDRLPQALEVGLAEDLFCLPLGREGDDRPVDDSLGNRADVDLQALNRARLASRSGSGSPET